jgi:UDP-glucose 4-epimerase
VINGDGSQAYDFISAQDTARANVLALQAEVSDRFYNVGTGVQTSIRELCNLILELKQSNLQVTYKPYSADDARRLVQNRIGSPDNAARDLGFRYKDTLRGGLLNLIAWRGANRGKY